MGLFNRREIRLLNERIALLVDECNSLRRANALLEGNITKLKRDNQLEDDKTVKLVTEQQNKEKIELARRVDRLNSEIKELRCKNDALQNELMTVEAAVQAKDKEIDVLTVQLKNSHDVNRENNKLREDIENLENALLGRDEEIVRLIAGQKGFNERLFSAILSELDNYTQEALANMCFDDKPYFKSLSDNLSEPRQLAALHELADFRVNSLNVSANVFSKNGNEYKTSLTDCTCEDFRFRGHPCKHMYCLALTLGLAHHLPFPEMRSFLNDYADKRIELDKKGQQLKKLEQELRNKDARKKKEWERIKNDAQQSVPYLAGLWAEHEALLSAREEAALREKKPPAEKAAYKVKAIGERLRAAVKLNKLLTYQLNYYESVFPWLLDFKKLDSKDAYNFASERADERDNTNLYISKRERKNLDVFERWQLALERYKHRRRTDWEAGIDYERFVCFEYEKQGYKVVSNGVLAGLEDMGRDLICFRGSEVLIIQCKRWREERTIHEKHIFQLYGSAITYSIEHPDKDVHAVFVTSAVLSDLARRCAERLEIQVIENHPLKDYPMIKCNLSRDGTKIFHMPYDQQYNRVQIDYSAGEFYAETVNEALEQGFRRAFRHRAET